MKTSIITISKLKPVFYLTATLFLLYNVYLSAVLVLRGEMHLTNDIGRDFLLLTELDQKKIVLIGARANTLGVFHGPLWTYMNYPAYLIGHGNPVAIGWFWVFLGLVFLSSSFFIFRKLFNNATALLAVCLLAVDLVTNTNNIFGQEATYYFMPFFLYSIYMYLRSKKMPYLILHLFTVGIFIQLNIGVGSLFAMLSIVLSLTLIIKNRNWNHTLSFVVLALCVSNFILFDMRHGFHIIKALLNLGGSSKFIIPINDWFNNRIDNIISMQIYANPGPQILITFLFIIVFTLMEIKNKSKHKNLFVILVYYYFGYFVLSWFNKGVMLVDYLYLLVPLSVFWLSALINGAYKFIFICILLIIVYINFNAALSYLSYTQNYFSGKAEDSWISLESVANSVIREQSGKEFGYFVYSPDAFAYQQRYAMIYSFKSAHLLDYEYVKKPVTYIISAPHPADNPYMSQDWWIKNEVKISGVPNEKRTFPSGYIVEKFQLSKAQQAIPFDPNIDLGLNFR